MVSNRPGGALMTRIAMALVLVLSGCLWTPALARQSANDIPATETPSQFYVRYRAAVLNATKLDDVLAFWRTAMVDEFKQAPPDQRADLAAMKRIYARMTDVKVTGETVGTSGGATVTLAGTSSDQKTMTG